MADCKESGGAPESRQIRLKMGVRVGSLSLSFLCPSTLWLLFGGVAGVGGENKPLLKTVL